MFKYLILFSSLAIASVAAFFSVTGLGQLFAGAFIPVVIMAAALEAGKLVTASFLTRYWTKLNITFRVYYGIAVVLLVLITSAGIYGFLSNAYQQTAFDVESSQTQVELYQNQRESIQEDIQRFKDRIVVLNEQRSSQQNQYKELTDGEDWVNAGRVYDQIERSDSIATELNEDINQKRSELMRVDSLLTTARGANLEVSREIGGFKFIAENFNAEVSSVVKWFIFIIIFVFDPLAVTLIIGYNYIAVYSTKDEHSGDDDDDDDDEDLQKIKPPIPIKTNVYGEVSGSVGRENRSLSQMELDKADNMVLSYMNVELHNPYTNNKIKIKDALKLSDEHPAKIQALEYIKNNVNMG